MPSHKASYLRMASQLPKGHPTRRKILSAIKEGGRWPHLTIDEHMEYAVIGDIDNDGGVLSFLGRMTFPNGLQAIFANGMKESDIAVGKVIRVTPDERVFEATVTLYVKALGWESKGEHYPVYFNSARMFPISMKTTFVIHKDDFAEGFPFPPGLFK